MADQFGLQVVPLLLLLLLLSVLLAVLVPSVRSYFLSCTRTRSTRTRTRMTRTRTSLTDPDPGERPGQFCSSTPAPLGRGARYHLEKIFTPSLEGLELDNSHLAVDLSSEQHLQDLEGRSECQYTLGDQTLHNLFHQLPDVSRSFLEGCEESEKCIQDETISDSMVNITFVC